jgi:hypothetical protein
MTLRWVQANAPHDDSASATVRGMGNLVLVAVIGFVAFIVFCCFATIAGLSRDEGKIKKLEANPGPTFATLFDGSPQVVYAPHDSSGGMTMATLLKGAGEHGYRMVQESGLKGTRSVVFEKTAR